MRGMNIFDFALPDQKNEANNPLSIKLTLDYICRSAEEVMDNMIESAR